MNKSVETIFSECVQAIRNSTLIVRPSRSDKEFAFQNWFKDRLDSLGLNYDSPGRNSYPDFRLVLDPVGFELKGLAYPGREASYDCNSRIPRGRHNGREVYYVFGRYPKEPDGDSYPVLDFVICHGSFLNADSSYEHKNRSFRGFGSYGDILVRDRKMYVAPTPFALADGTAHNRTLILPSNHLVEPEFHEVGTLIRREVDEVVASYEFNLQTNILTTEMMENPGRGLEHVFKAYRTQSDSLDPVRMRSQTDIVAALIESEVDPDEECGS